RRWKKPQCSPTMRLESSWAKWERRPSANPNCCPTSKPAMRILQVSSARTFGGGETHVLELVEALRKRGHDVLVAGRRNGPLNPDIPFSMLRLRSILKHERFDIVHAHAGRDYSIVAASALGVKGVKVVFTRHLLYPVRPHLLYRRVDGWIAPTAQILNTLAPLKPKKSVVIPNWVDLEKFS